MQLEVVWKTFLFSTKPLLSISNDSRPPFFVTVLISALAFIILLSLLILIHEWGHYFAAIKSGVVVEEFGFGLPPKARKLFKKGKTEFTLNWIPFGGFVRLKGENALSEKERRGKGSFGAAPVHAKVIILLAGVFMNWLLALVLLTIGFSSLGGWIPTYLSVNEMQVAGERGEINLQLGVMIDEVVGGGAAAKVGVPSRAILRTIDSEPIVTPDEVSAYQDGRSRVTYRVSLIDEEGKVAEESQTFRVTLDEGKSGIVIVSYPIELSSPDRDVLTAFLLAARETRVMTMQTVLGIGRLFSSLVRTGRVPEGIAGIVGIAQLTHASVQEGFMTYMRLVALLSLSLAALNVLPFPALDGGRLLFVIAEVINRKPLNRQFELTANALGFGFLLLLILLITFYDIVRLF